MLDSTLIKFVEPIGPGQIVDRDSLVALPIGYVQVSIENENSEIIVKILGLKGMYSTQADSNLPPNTVIKTYIWQNGEVVAGEEIVEQSAVETRPRPISKFASFRRPRSNCTNFRFVKHPRNCESEEAVVDGILQICAYKPTGHANLQRKIFLGTVHIALKCLTSTQFKSSEESLVGTEEWYKVFPKSSFLPGSPSDIAKTNCYISRPNIVEEEEEEEENDEILLDGEEESSICSSTIQGSVVSFSQFALKNSRKPSVFISPGTVLSGARTRQATIKYSRPQNAILKLLRRYKSEDEIKPRYTASRRLPKPLMHSTSAPATTLPPFLVGSPTSTTSRVSFMSSFKSSCSSTYSSTSDIGYESSRSECGSTFGEEENTKVQKKSTFRNALENAFRSVGKARNNSLPRDIPSSTSANSSLARPVTIVPPSCRKLTKQMSCG